LLLVVVGYIVLNVQGKIVCTKPQTDGTNCNQHLKNSAAALVSSFNMQQQKNN
jgi:hypothetical protein